MKIQVKRKGRGVYSVMGACVDIEYSVLGPIANNTYVISDGDFTFVVDPSHDSDAILKMVGNRSVDAIVVTHHHADHTSALKALKDKTGAPVYASAIDTPVIENQPKDFPPAESCKVDVQLKDKQTAKLGNMAWKVLATPGHTPGGICLFLESDKGKYFDGANVLISGDTLFCGSIGRTDFEGGNDKQMRASLRRLSQLPNDTLVLPGHNSLTTIADEQRRVFAYFC